MYYLTMSGTNNINTKHWRDMKTRTETITVEIEVEVEVSFSVDPPEKGSCEGGMKMEPDIPAELYDIEILTKVPDFDKLEEKMQEYIRGECWNSLQE